MCGRYTLTLLPRDMQELFDYLNAIEFPPRYNIAPTQPIVAIWQAHGQRLAHLVRWGLVPSWVRDPTKFPLLINARAETMAEKPAFRTALRNLRCIVPASGYYEWLTGADGGKQPFYITRADGGTMAFAGLYSVWSGPEGEEVDTAAIVTTAAGPDTIAIHERMPVVLEGEAIEAWLDTANVGSREAMALARPLPAGSLRAHKVSKAVGSNKSDGPQLIMPVALDETKPEGGPAPSAKPEQLDLF